MRAGARRLLIRNLALLRVKAMFSMPCDKPLAKTAIELEKVARQFRIARGGGWISHEDRETIESNSSDR